MLQRKKERTFVAVSKNRKPMHRVINVTINVDVVRSPPQLTSASQSVQLEIFVSILIKKFFHIRIYGKKNPFKWKLI